MKKLMITSAIALLFALNITAATDGTKLSGQTKVQIFQTNKQSVDVYVAKPQDDLVKIIIESESGAKLMTTRVKKQNARYIRYHLNELPDGNYKVLVTRNNEVLKSFDLTK